MVRVFPPSSLRLVVQKLIRVFPSTIGMYKGGKFLFTFFINSNYPHDPPKVKCVPKVCALSLSPPFLSLILLLTRFLSYKPQKIYHPNLDLEGNVCLNILREDWKPILNLHAVVVGLQYLFLEPNADDPLNKGSFLSLVCSSCFL